MLFVVVCLFVVVVVVVVFVGGGGGGGGGERKKEMELMKVSRVYILFIKNCVISLFGIDRGNKVITTAVFKDNRVFNGKILCLVTFIDSS